jgi:membrane associated rhomboid family serine protease
VATLWLLELADTLIWRGGLDAYGIHPRTLHGLRNIALAPWLHGDLWHVAANTVPLVVLGWMVMVRGVREFVAVSVIAAVVSGLGVWLFGASNSVHIGASGVVFGYLGYLLARGILERSVTAVLLAVLAVLLYGGMLFGVLPGQPGISWLGHLFGLLGGALAAYLVVNRGRRPSPPSG